MRRKREERGRKKGKKKGKRREEGKGKEKQILPVGKLMEKMWFWLIKLHVKKSRIN